MLDPTGHRFIQSSQISIAADCSWIAERFARDGVGRSVERPHDGMTARLPPPLLNTRCVNPPSVLTCASCLCSPAALASQPGRPSNASQLPSSTERCQAVVARESPISEAIRADRVLEQYGSDPRGDPTVRLDFE
jgi:hypothetical protein